jgi:hypothetical protein
MNVVETEENLLRDLFTDMVGNSSMVIPFDESEEILAENFENHADMVPVRPSVSEVIEERYDVPPTGMGRVGLDDSL